MSATPNEYGRARKIRRQVTRWMSEPDEAIRPGHETCVRTLPASPEDVTWLLDELTEAHRRMQVILVTIYTTHGYLDGDGEINTAAKFRAIERLARLDWGEDGVSRIFAAESEETT